MKRGSWQAAASVSVFALLCLPWTLGLQCQQGPATEVTNDGWEPNDLTLEATELVLDFSGTVVVSGIMVPNDTDCFAVGPLMAGDQILVAFQTAAGSGLNLSCAIFDQAEQLFVIDDPLDTVESPTNPSINLGIRHDSDRYFVCVRQSSRVRQLALGEYTMRVTVFFGTAQIQPRQQTLFLNFNGSLDADIDIPNVGPFTLPAFDASQLNPSFVGLSDQLKDLIQGVIEERFAQFDLRILNSDDHARPTNQDFAIVHFGGNSTISQGASQLVDTYNAWMDDQAIVFTDNWVSNFYSDVPGFNLMDAAVTIGQVACLQIGKLLGLVDVNNPSDTMDFLADGVPASPSTFQRERTLQSSILDGDIWPFGFQNGPQLVEEMLGQAPPQPP